MSRNQPIQFPQQETEFREKWLSNWNGDDWGNSKKIDEACKKYTERIKTLSTSERKRLLLELIGYIDLTTLSGDDTKERVCKLMDRAMNPLGGTKHKNESIQCAAICFYPARLCELYEHLAQKKDGKKNVGIAVTAGGFPSGQYRLESRLLEVQLAVADGATEVDIVINRAAALSEDWKLIHHEVSLMRLACGDKAHMKTILATGELVTMERIYTASMTSMMAGSDFIKTSTGKETVNATLPVAYVMCHAIAHYRKLTGIQIGFKPAGGIRTPDEALGFVFLVEHILGKEWLNSKLFRIGASTLLDNIVKELDQIDA